jgi:hypothetical protein
MEKLKTSCLNLFACALLLTFIKDFDLVSEDFSLTHTCAHLMAVIMFCSHSAVPVFF